MKTDIVSRMEAMQSRFSDDEVLRSLKFALAPLDDRTDEQKAIGSYYDRVMSERGDNGELDQLSEDYAIKELGEGWRQ
jgi:hypothetical protein